MTRKIRNRTWPVQLYNTVVSIANLILSLLPSWLQLRILFVRDMQLTLRDLVLGRWLPSLTLSHPTNDLTGKTAIITGSNSGIGLQIATDLARQNCTVYLACRSESKARSAIKMIDWRVPGSRGKVKFIKLDTSDLESVRSCAVAWSEKDDGSKDVDLLIHNAGIPAPPFGADTGMTSPEGLEVMYATNFLGGFLLTHFLEPYLTGSARVVLTTSASQYYGGIVADFALGPVRGVVEAGFHCLALKVMGQKIALDSAASRYANTKLMQACFTRLLQERFDRLVEQEGSGNDGRSRRRKTAHCFHPGFVDTTIFSKMHATGIVMKVARLLFNFAVLLTIDVEEGAATGSWLSMTDDGEVIGEGKGGGYWDRQIRRISQADIMKRETLDRLWVRWEKDVGIDWR